MKTRNGFVSNSSSTSFLIYGVALDEEQAEAVKISELNDKRFDIFYGDPNNYERNYYIGISWDRIGDQETGEQFRNNIEEKLKAVLGPDIKCSTHEESYFNG